MKVGTPVIIIKRANDDYKWFDWEQPGLVGKITRSTLFSRPNLFEVTWVGRNETLWYQHQMYGVEIAPLLDVDEWADELVVEV